METFSTTGAGWRAVEMVMRHMAPNRSIGPGEL